MIPFAFQNLKRHFEIQYLNDSLFANKINLSKNIKPNTTQHSSFTALSRLLLSPNTVCKNQIHSPFQSISHALQISITDFTIIIIIIIIIFSLDLFQLRNNRDNYFFFLLYQESLWIAGLREEYATEAKVAATTGPHAASFASTAADVPPWHARRCYVSG